jgi:hypothetical protein
MNDGLIDVTHLTSLQGPMADSEIEQNHFEKTIDLDSLSLIELSRLSHHYGHRAWYILVPNLSGSPYYFLGHFYLFQ